MFCPKGYWIWIPGHCLREYSDPMKLKAFHYYTIPLLLLVLCIAMASCEQDLPPNPYDEINNDPIDTTQVDSLDPNSFAFIHQNILQPTCANSGCHDGTFEPDYRTIESAYNTLVYHPVVKNDTLNSFKYRVLPGNASKSMLYIRLTQDLNGNSGVMPLEIEPGSDWRDKREEYIKNIKNWIEAGARDIFGNRPTKPNLQPQMLGIIAMPAGSSTPFNRASNGAILVPPGVNSIDIWFSLKDDSTATSALLHNKVKFSLFMNDFSAAQERDLTIVSSPVVEEGYEGGPVEYYHKITINPFDFGIPGNNIFMRIYVKDPQNAITEIPAVYSENAFKTYFTLVLLQ